MSFLNMKPKKTESTDKAQAAQPAAGNPIYKLTEAAQILECNERTLLDKLRAGEIKGRKRMGRWFITHANLIAYVND